MKGRSIIVVAALVFTVATSLMLWNWWPSTSSPIATDDKRKTASTTESEASQDESFQASPRDDESSPAADRDDLAVEQPSGGAGFASREGSREKDAFHAAIVGLVALPDGEPLTDAQVALYQSRRSLGDRRYDGLVRQTRSGADGTFRIRLDRPFEGYLVLDEPGYEPMEDPLKITASGEVRRHYRLREAAELVWGHVYDSNTGTPVADIPVALSFNAECGRVPDGILLYRRTRTDELGRFFFHRVRRGENFYVESGSSDYMPDSARAVLSEEEDERQVDLSVRPSTLVQLRILDEEGRALPTASVAYMSVPLPAVKADEDGQVQLQVDLKAPTSCTVRARGYVSREILIEGPSAAEMEVRLKSSPVLRGGVVNENGTPVSRAAVEVWAEGRRLSGTGGTDETGHFEAVLSRFPIHRVVARHKDYLSSEVPLQGGDDPREVQIVLQRGSGSIAGRVVSSEGVPVARFWVQATRRSSPDHSEGRQDTGEIVDPQGRFQITGLPPGIYDLQASSVHDNPRELESGTVKGFEISDGLAVTDVLIQLRRNVPKRGRR